jgi:hypothetical protein
VKPISKSVKLFVLGTIVLLAVSWSRQGVQNAAAQPAATPSVGPSTNYVGYPSPAQEPGPANGTEASAIGTISFDPYLTQAQINFYLTGLDPAEITAFHLHCGLPGQLGPIVINFNQFGAFNTSFVDGVFSVTVTDADVREANWPPTKTGIPPACEKNAIGPAPATTLAGIDALARVGQLYFNVHTGKGKDRTFVFGLIRGQVYPVDMPMTATGQLGGL